MSPSIFNVPKYLYALALAVVIGALFYHHSASSKRSLQQSSASVGKDGSQSLLAPEKALHKILKEHRDAKTVLAASIFNITPPVSDAAIPASSIEGVSRGSASSNIKGNIKGDRMGTLPEEEPGTKPLNVSSSMAQLQLRCNNVILALGGEEVEELLHRLAEGSAKLTPTELPVICGGCCEMKDPVGTGRACYPTGTNRNPKTMGPFFGDCSTCTRCPDGGTSQDAAPTLMRPCCVGTYLKNGCDRNNGGGGMPTEDCVNSENYHAGSGSDGHQCKSWEDRCQSAYSVCTSVNNPSSQCASLKCAVKGAPGLRGGTKVDKC